MLDSLLIFQTEQFCVYVQIALVKALLSIQGRELHTLTSFSPMPITFKLDTDSFAYTGRVQFIPYLGLSKASIYLSHIYKCIPSSH